MGKNQDAIDQAAAKFESIMELLDKVESNTEDYTAHEEALQEVYEFPLSVQVRDGWRQPGAASEGAEEYEVLLCWGGPAVRLRGALGLHDQPTSVCLEWQDWGTPWTAWQPQFKGERQARLLDFVNLLYFGG